MGLFSWARCWGSSLFCLPCPFQASIARLKSQSPRSLGLRESCSGCALLALVRCCARCSLASRNVKAAYGCGRSTGRCTSVGGARGESPLVTISSVVYGEKECRAVKVWKPFRAVKGRQRREAIFLRARLSRSCNLRRYLPSSLRQITTRYHVAALYLVTQATCYCFSLTAVLQLETFHVPAPTSIPSRSRSILAYLDRHLVPRTD